VKSWIETGKGIALLLCIMLALETCAILDKVRFFWVFRVPPIRTGWAQNRVNRVLERKAKKLHAMHHGPLRRGGYTIGIGPNMIMPIHQEHAPQAKAFISACESALAWNFPLKNYDEYVTE
jgi:hypothetical protein